MCWPLGVTRGSYYRHLNKAVDYYHLELIEAVQELAKASDHTYGSRRMKAALGLMSYPVSRNKAKKLMKEAGVLVKRRKKFKVTTDSNHAKPLFDNILDRDFAPKASDRHLNFDPRSKGNIDVFAGEQAYRKRAVIALVVAFF